MLQLEGSTAASASSFDKKLAELTAKDLELSHQLKQLQPDVERLNAQSAEAAEAAASLLGRVEVGKLV